MEKGEFIKLIQDELTVSCALGPVKIKAEQMDLIIRNSARWFYDNWADASEDQFIIIHRNKFSSRDWKETRMIKMPDCVRAVSMCQESDRSLVTGNVDKDFSANKFLMAEMFLSPFSSDNLLYRVVQYSMFDLSKHFVLKELQFQYNPNSKRLFFPSRNIHRDVIVRAAIDLPLEDLFEDDRFRRYVLAYAKKQAGRALTFMEMNLIGGVALNVQDIKDEGREEMDAIIEEIKNDANPADYMMIFP